MVDNPKYLFYSVIGKHGKESAEQILSRKQKEIKSAGYSLWSAKIDKGSICKAWALSIDDKVFVLCHLNPKAKDPVNSSAVLSASCMVGPGGKDLIADGINTTFKATYNEFKPYQAYVVRNYKILPDAETFDFDHYVSYTKSGPVSFGERWSRFSQFQNTFGQYSDDISCPYTKDISVVMELQYPFVVNIF